MQLDRLAFPLMGIIIILLITASVLEQFIGTEAVIRYVYAAPWTIALWLLTVVCAIYYLCVRRVWRTPFTFLLHFSFVIILGGALVTHLFGEQGQIHLRMDTDKPESARLGDSEMSVRLADFYVEYYSGTHAPMDFVTKVEISDHGKMVSGTVSMNNIFEYRHYRLYQSMFDSDMRGTILTYSHDPWGIGITYAGYALLLFSILGFFFQKRSYFRTLLRGTAILAVIVLSQPVSAGTTTSTPPTVNKQTADAFGNLYVYYNDRVCPMQTLAKDFTTKLYGKTTYKGLSANEVLCGWLFYYDQWADEPCIKIKGKETRRVLGLEGKYACLNDFVGKGKYKLEDGVRNREKNAIAADEKFQLISMVCTARLLKIYPIETGDKNSKASQPTSDITWYSWSDQLPATVKPEDWQYVYRSMDFVFLCIARNANAEACDALTKIRAWQTEHAGSSNLPTDTRFKSEKLFNSLNYTRPLAMACATIGLLAFIIFIVLINKKVSLVWLNHILNLMMLCAFVFLTFALTLRWIISGHIPLSNGHETMQFLAWTAMLLTLVGQIIRRQVSHNLLIPSGWLVAGMTLMVSMMSESNPQITNLMPVLQSPLLTIHVAIIMIAYCLLAFIMLNSISGIISDRKMKTPAQHPTDTMRLSLLMLYPAIFCHIIGIFIGAVWANISWGRYWGWDPKEVWALITMLVYAFPLHSQSLKIFRRPIFFHLYMLIAFLSVLFTYFGVNFLLGGLHSYA